MVSAFLTIMCGFVLQLTVQLPWKSEPERFHFKFKAPVEITFNVRTCMSPSPMTFVSSTMRNLRAFAVSITNARLNYGDQLAEALVKEHAALTVSKLSAFTLHPSII